MSERGSRKRDASLSAAGVRAGTSHRGRNIRGGGALDEPQTPETQGCGGGSAYRRGPLIGEKDCLVCFG